MAIVAKNDQTPDPGAGSPKPDGEPGPSQPIRHNLPLKAAPVIGRRAEMQQVVGIFDRIRRAGGPRRVEVVGPRGVGATTVAVELARRAGHRFPGGAWYVHLGVGADLAWASLGAVRGANPVTNLRAAANAAREKLGAEPKALLVVDGATSADEVMKELPPVSEQGADVFLVAEKPLGTVDAVQVCEVSPVPRHGARRMAHSMLRHGQPDGRPPAVRTLDGLAVTASLAARIALAYGGKQGPLSFSDAGDALQRIVQLVARHPTALELLLIASVAHPVSVPVEALFGALTHVRKGRGKEPTMEDAGSGVMWLAHAGILEPADEEHFSMHPLLQQAVHAMTQSPADLAVARESLIAGLLPDAEASVTDAGVDLPRASLHQLRHLAATAAGDAQVAAAAAVAKIEEALGVSSNGGAAQP